MGDRLYRLESCYSCRSVFLGLNTAAKRRYPGRIVYVSPGNTPIYMVDFCETCRRDHDKHMEALAAGAAAAGEGEHEE